MAQPAVRHQLLNSATMMRRPHEYLGGGLAGLFRRPAQSTQAALDLALSLPELRCAYGHALSTYGDLEVYVSEFVCTCQPEHLVTGL